MNERLQQYLDRFAKSIAARSQSERILVLGIVLAGISLVFLSMVSDPLKADIERAGNRIVTVQGQIVSQQNEYARMDAASREDPDKFANDRLIIISREQEQLTEQISALAGDLVTPNQMTEILTTVLERQSGLELVYFQNEAASPLREGVSNASSILAETGTLNFADASESEVVGQVYEHGLVIEFQGDYFSTLKYLRFLEEITGSFFWDSITFRQLEWPSAHITLEIHTLSADQGFIGA